jgi:hypothetical protein
MKVCEGSLDTRTPDRGGYGPRACARSGGPVVAHSNPERRPHTVDERQTGRNMAKEKVVWVSRAMMDSTLIKSFFHSDVYFADKELALDAMRRTERSDPLPADRYPKEIYAKYPDKWMSRQPDIFTASGFWAVSAALAELLRQFNLGRTALYPTRLFQHNRKTLVDGDYFCLGFGETKEVFLPHQSPRARKPYPERDLWKLSLDPKDDDLAVSTRALDGADLWMDPKVLGGSEPRRDYHRP